MVKDKIIVLELAVLLEQQQLWCTFTSQAGACGSAVRAQLSAEPGVVTPLQQLKAEVHGPAVKLKIISRMPEIIVFS